MEKSEIKKLSGDKPYCAAPGKLLRIINCAAVKNARWQKNSLPAMFFHPAAKNCRAVRTQTELV